MDQSKLAPASEASTIVPPLLRGSMCVTKHTVRDVKVYAILDNEMSTIGILNVVTTAAVSIGTGLLSFMAALLADVAKEPEAVTRPDIVTFTCWACVILAIVAYGIAGLTFRARKTQLDEIRSESRTIE
jgi:hypothetical protein